MWSRVRRNASSRRETVTRKMSSLFLFCLVFLLAEAEQLPVRQANFSFVEDPEEALNVEDVYDICRTEACYLTASEILSGMDTNTEPCVDFYNFVCKNWRDNNPDLREVPIRDQFVNAELQLLSGMRDILEKKEEDDETEGFKLARKLFNTCNDQSNVEQQVNIIRKMLDDANGWPLMNQSKIVGDNSWHDVDIHFIKNFATTWLYDIRGGPINANSEYKVLTMSPPLFKRPPYMNTITEEGKEKYARFIEKAAEILLGPEEYEAIDKTALRKEIDDMINFEIAVQSSSSKGDPMCHPVESSPKDLQDLFSGVNKYSKIDWLTRLTELSHIPKNETLHVMCAKYIELLVNLTRSTNDRVIVNYIHWRVIVELLPKIDWALGNELYPQDAYKPRWQQCVERNEALTSVLYRFVEKVLPSNKTKKALDIYEMVDATSAWRFLSLKDRLRGTHVRLSAYALHEKVKLHFKDLEYYFDQFDYKKKFDPQNVKPTYVENLVEAMVYGAKALIKTKGEPIRQPVGVTPKDTKIKYNLFTPERYVPIGAVQFPFYHPDRPHSLNFGAFGSIVASSIMTEFWHYLVASYNGDNRIVSFPDTSRNSFISNGETTLDKWDMYPLKTKATREVIKKHDLYKVFEHVAESDAVRMAFQAYERDFKLREWKDVRLPGLEKYNHKQLFFLAYANAHCSASNRINLRTVEDISQSVIAELDMEVRRKVILSLLQTDEFGQSFGCRKGGWMYPTNNKSFW